MIYFLSVYNWFFKPRFKIYRSKRWVVDYWYDSNFVFLEESSCCHYILIFQTVETVGFGLDVLIHTQPLQDGGLYFCSYCHQIVFIELLYKKEMQDFFLQKKRKETEPDSVSLFSLLSLFLGSVPNPPGLIQNAVMLYSFFLCIFIRRLALVCACITVLIIVIGE